jgi:hypothetical protein
MRRYLMPLLCSLALLCSLVALPSAAAAAGSDGIRVIPPVGNTYGEWGAKFWQWSYSMPVDAHPLFDTAGIGASQKGPVWFIGGTFVSNDLGNGNYEAVVHRSGTVPQGKALFFPLVNAEASRLEGNGAKPKELTGLAQALTDCVVPSTLFCQVDGEDLDFFRALSHPAVYGPLPDNSILQWEGYPGVEAGDTSLFVADGYYTMLAPLPVGKHTVHFGGFLDASALLGTNFTLDLDITYEVTVQ